MFSARRLISRSTRGAQLLLRGASSNSGGQESGLRSGANGSVNGSSPAERADGSIGAYVYVGRLIYNFFFSKRSRYPKARQTKMREDEIEVVLPIPGFDKKQIKMFVDTNNVLRVIGEKEEEVVDLYQDPMKKCRQNDAIFELPKVGNFEKATYEARLDKGEVIVNIKGFKRKDVTIHFTDEEDVACR